jgi:hypothetical protein
MFHYPIFGCLGAVFAAADVAICCILFTNCYTPLSAAKTVADCSQTVAICCTAQQMCNSVSREARAISFVYEGADQANVDGTNSTATPKKFKIGTSLLALSPFDPARDEDRASDLGLRRD